jgi:hypothetical protein
VDGDPLENPRVLDDPEKIVVVIQGGVLVKDLR